MTLEPHQFWQTIEPPGTFARDPAGYVEGYPAQLADGRQVLLPIRVLPGNGRRAVASLILNQASFAVEDGLAAALAELVAPLAPEVIVGVPTLGLPLAANVARRLGHSRMVALGTSRKFWYRDELSEPLRSITSPEVGKTLFIDPRMLPLLAGKRVLVIDDVISSGTSMAAVLRLLDKAGVVPVGIGVAMVQGMRWRGLLAQYTEQIKAAIASPLLELTDETGRWRRLE